MEAVRKQLMKTLRDTMLFLYGYSYNLKQQNSSKKTEVNSLVLRLLYSPSHVTSFCFEQPLTLLIPAQVHGLKYNMV